MKTVTRTYNLYSAKELKETHPKAFQKALEKYNDGHDDFWHDTVYQDFLSIASLMGFAIEEKDIQWSGFSCQGDGASFTGTATFAADALEKVKDYAGQDTELHRIAAECAEYGKAGIRCRLERISHHYSHENTVEPRPYQMDQEENEEDLPEELETEVQETCRALMRWLYRQLEKDYEYRCSEECFLENAKLNEWTFTAEGEMENE